MFEKWSLERRLKNDKVVFQFSNVGDLDDFKTIVKILEERLGGTITRRVDGPYASLLTVSVKGQSLVFAYDAAEVIFFFASDPDKTELAEQFTIDLKQALNAR